MTERFKIEEVVEIEGFPASKIVGIDRYRLMSLSGKEKKWPSYTLVSDDKGVWSRWWITEEGGKLYYWSSASENEVKGEIDLDDSGLCALDAEGDSIFSSDYSSVVVFRDGSDLYCIEAFKEEVLIMKGTLIHY